LRGDEVGRDDGGPDLGPLGDDLEERVGLLLVWDDIAQFVQTQERHFGIVLDEVVGAFGLGQFRGEVEEGDEDGLVALEDGLMAKRGRQMGLADAGRADEHQVIARHGQFPTVVDISSHRDLYSLTMIVREN
jgi:hypothetical protein